MTPTGKPESAKSRYVRPMHRVTTTEIGRESTGSWKESRPFLVLCGALLVVLEALGAIRARSVAKWDFRTFYTAGYLLRTHRADLYSWIQQKWVQDHLIAPGMTVPFVSPAYEAILFAPLTLMRYERAYLCFMVINFALLLAAFWVARDTFSDTIPFVQPRPGLMLLAFFPLLVALQHGQLSIILLLMCCATWTALKRGRVALAGLILAAGICKFNVILPIAFILALRWRWRFVAGFASGVAAALGASIMLVGTHGMTMLMNLLRADTLMKNQGAEAQHLMTAFPLSMVNLYALVYVGVHKLNRPGMTFWLTMALSLVVVAVCAWLTQRDQRDEVVFSIAVVCGLLVSYHMYIHDLTLLLLPLALLRGIRNYKALVIVSYTWPVLVPVLIDEHHLFLLAPMLLWTVWLIARSQERKTEPSVCLEVAEASA